MFKYLVDNVLFWFGLVFFAAGSLFLYEFILADIKQKEFDDDGKIVVGSVVAKRIDIETTNKRTRKILVLLYSFTLPNTPPQKGESDVGFAKYDRTNIGDKIEVEYVSSQPTIHRLRGTGKQPPGFISILGFIFALLGLAMVIPAIRRAAKQLRLLNNGLALSATVTKLVCHNSNAKDKSYQILYKYKGPEDEDLTGKSQYHSSAFFMRIGEGSTIDILADPKKPSVSAWRKEVE